MKNKRRKMKNIFLNRIIILMKIFNYQKINKNKYKAFKI